MSLDFSASHRAAVPARAWFRTGSLASLALLSLLSGLAFGETNRSGGDLATFPMDADKAEAVQKSSAAATESHEVVDTNSVGMDMVFIPRGSFLMGAPTNEPGRFRYERQHTVTISKPFRMASTNVTQGQWQTVMGKAAASKVDDELPVVNVTWLEAVEFCKRLSAKENQTYRLPTEAEWEYACRAGMSSAFNWDTKEGRDDHKKFQNAHHGKALAVGSSKPNAWGLHEMTGDTYQWCSDWFNDYSGGSAADPVGPAKGSARVIRGGNFNSPPERARSAYRNAFAPDRGLPDLGLRPVLVESTVSHKLRVGDPAPPLTVAKWIKGGQPAAGSILVVDFCATWCGPCVASIPHISAIQSKYADKKVAVVGMASFERDPSKLEPFVKKMGDKMSYSVALDALSESGYYTTGHAWFDAAGMTGIPCVFVVDRQGIITYIGSPAGIERAVDDAIAKSKNAK